MAGTVLTQKAAVSSIWLAADIVEAYNVNTREGNPVKSSLISTLGLDLKKTDRKLNISPDKAPSIMLEHLEPGQIKLAEMFEAATQNLVDRLESLSIATDYKHVMQRVIVDCPLWNSSVSGESPGTAERCRGQNVDLDELRRVFTDEQTMQKLLHGWALEDMLKPVYAWTHVALSWIGGLRGEVNTYTRTRARTRTHAHARTHARTHTLTHSLTHSLTHTHLHTHTGCQPQVERAIL